MSQIEKFFVEIKKGSIVSETFWINTIGVIQGLSYGLCSIPDKTSLYDCEIFNEFAIIPVYCTKTRFDELKRILKELYGDMCDFGEDKTQ